MYKIGIFVKTKSSERLLKWLPARYETYDDADRAVIERNAALGVPDSGSVKPGSKFAMFDSA